MEHTLPPDARYLVRRATVRDLRQGDVVLTPTADGTRTILSDVHVRMADAMDCLPDHVRLMLDALPEAMRDMMLADLPDHEPHEAAFFTDEEGPQVGIDPDQPVLVIEDIQMADDEFNRGIDDILGGA